MIDWSDAIIKTTFGVGGLAIIAMLAETYEDLPFWLTFFVAMMPLAIFVFIKPREWSPTVVKLSHLLAAGWFLVTAAISAVLYTRSESPDNWPVYSVLLSAGILPSIYVIWRIVAASKGPGDETDRIA